MKAVQVTCPNCGARLRVGEVEPVVQCDYCGTASRVQRRTRFLERALPPPADGPAPIAVQQHNPAVVFVLIGAVAGTLVMGGIVASVVARAPSNASRPISAAAPAREVARPSWAGRAPLVADLDGDGTPDLVGRARRVHPVDQITLLALDGATGALRWESEPLGTYGETYQGTLALAGDTVIFASPRGELRTFALATGQAVWRRQLDERIEQLCQGDDDATFRALGKDGIVRVLRRDDGEVSVDAPAANARPAQRKPTCVGLPDDEARMPGRFLHHDRSKLPRDLPLDVEGAFERPTETVLHGRRKTGTQAAMLAVLDGDRRLRWSAVVPTDPLGSVERAPLMVVPSEEAVCASYYGESVAGAIRVTCFAMADGARLWDWTGNQWTSLLGRVGAALAISDGSALLAVEIATGATRWKFP